MSGPSTVLPRSAEMSIGLTAQILFAYRSAAVAALRQQNGGPAVKLLLRYRWALGSERGRLHRCDVVPDRLAVAAARRRLYARRSDRQPIDVTPEASGLRSLSHPNPPMGDDSMWPGQAHRSTARTAAESPWQGSYKEEALSPYDAFRFPDRVQSICRWRYPSHRGEQVSGQHVAGAGPEAHVPALQPALKNRRRLSRMLRRQVRDRSGSSSPCFWILSRGTSW